MTQVFNDAIKKLWAGELDKLPADEVPAERIAEIQHSKFESGFTNHWLYHSHTSDNKLFISIFYNIIFNY